MPQWFPKKISGEMNLWLARLLLEEENYQTVKSIKLEKSPSSNGFTSTFYLKYWELVKHDVIHFIHQIFDEGESLKFINQTFITLIPKIRGASTMNQFWLISIINTPYKINSKLIANRLAHVLLELISP